MGFILERLYLQVEGMGAMEVSTNKGTKKVKHIYYTPNLNHNLLSVGQIVERNYRLMFEYAQCKIYDKSHGNRIITNVPMNKNRLFPLKFG